MKVKYPEIEVQLTGEDGNAFTIIGVVRTALRDCGVSHEKIQEFEAEALSGNYDDLLRTAMRWVSVG